MRSRSRDPGGSRYRLAPGALGPALAPGQGGRTSGSRSSTGAFVADSPGGVRTDAVAGDPGTYRLAVSPYAGTSWYVEWDALEYWSAPVNQLLKRCFRTRPVSVGIPAACWNAISACSMARDRCSTVPGLSAPPPRVPAGGSGAPAGTRGGGADTGHGRRRPRAANRAGADRVPAGGGNPRRRRLRAAYESSAREAAQRGLTAIRARPPRRTSSFLRRG